MKIVLRVKPWPNRLASSRRLNLRRDLRQMAEQTRKFPRKCTEVTKKNIVCHWLIVWYYNEWTSLASTWMQIGSRPKWAQNIARQRTCKCTQSLAKWSRIFFNLGLYASSSGQGLTAVCQVSAIERIFVCLFKTLVCLSWNFVFVFSFGLLPIFLPI